MAGTHKTLDQQLADIRDRKKQLALKEQQLQARQKARDIRQRAKGEKLVLQLVLDCLNERPEIRAALLDLLAATDLKPEDRDAALSLLGAAATVDAALTA